MEPLIIILLIILVVIVALVIRARAEIADIVTSFLHIRTQNNVPQITPSGELSPHVSWLLSSNTQIITPPRTAIISDTHRTQSFGIPKGHKFAELKSYSEQLESLKDNVEITGKTGLDKIVNIGNELGRGAFGGVYEASYKEPAYSGRNIIVKYQDDVDLNMIEREVKSYRKAAQAACGNIAELHEVFLDTTITHTSAYFVMDRVSGISMAKLILSYPNENGIDYTTEIIKLWPSEDEFIDNIILPMVNGIRCLHDNEIAHRDIKPDNTMIKMPEKRAVIVDLGVCCLNDVCQGIVSGTPDYISPELYKYLPNQLVAHLYTPSVIVPINWITAQYAKNADIWALGATIFELLSGNILLLIINWIRETPAYAAMGNIPPPQMALMYLFNNDKLPTFGSWKRVSLFLRNCLIEDPNERRQVWNQMTNINLKSYLTEKINEKAHSNTP